MLFQDETGGLELRDPQTGEFIHAEPEDGTLVLNIGDMLGRFTNGKSPRRTSVAVSY
jgi:isopenicillin N synthase-like dioxygenase